MQGREGDDPKTAIYTCSGCGTTVVGFGRWRNHMKRSQKQKLVAGLARSYDANMSGKKKTSFQNVADFHDHVQAVLPKPLASTSLKQTPAPLATGKKERSDFVPSPTFAGRRPGYVFKSGASGVGYYVDSPAAPSHQSKKKAPQHVETIDGRGSERPLGVGGNVAATAPKAAGKRWLGEPNANGKRQRKFF